MHWSGWHSCNVKEKFEYFPKFSTFCATSGHHWVRILLLLLQPRIPHLMVVWHKAGIRHHVEAHVRPVEAISMPSLISRVPMVSHHVQMCHRLCLTIDNAQLLGDKTNFRSTFLSLDSLCSFPKDSTVESLAEGSRLDSNWKPMNSCFSPVEFEHCPAAALAVELAAFQMLEPDQQKVSDDDLSYLNNTEIHLKRMKSYRFFEQHFPTGCDCD